MSETEDGDLGFRYRAAKRGEVFVHHRGRLATALGGTAAADFLRDIDGASFAEQQQVMAVRPTARRDRPPVLDIEMDQRYFDGFSFSFARTSSRLKAAAFCRWG
jgi:hypothetical protein